MTASLQEYLGVEGRSVRLVETGGEQPSAVARKLSLYAGWLRVEQAGGTGARRTRLFGLRPHGSIEFVGDIEQRQLEPLVEALRSLATGRIELDTPATASLLGELDHPVALVVVVSPECPYCPRIAATVLRFALSSPRVAVQIVRSEVAEAPPNITAVPTVLVDGHVVAQGGAIGEYALAERITGIAAS